MTALKLPDPRDKEGGSPLRATHTMEEGQSPEHRRLPDPQRPESVRVLSQLLRDWGYDPDPYGDFERTGIVVHSGHDWRGRVTITPRPNNPAWQVEAIHRSWKLKFNAELTRVAELQCLLQLVLRTDLPNPEEQGEA